MLDLAGKEQSIYCDGISRRSVLRVGALGLGGWTLADLLRVRAEAAASGLPSQSDTAVIFVEMAGGPTHIETYDPKPKAPSEFRGPLGYVKTSVPGIIFSQMMTEQAKVADKLAVIRSVHHDSSSHRTSSHLTQTGYYLSDRQKRENDMPSAGAITSKLRGANASGIPAYVSVPRDIRYGGAAYIGKEHNPLVTGDDPNSSNFEVRNLSLHKSLSLDRLQDRRTLLSGLDRRRRLADIQHVATAYDQFAHEAFEMVTGKRAQEAFDIGQEPDKVRRRYGRNTEGQSMLLARRLVEAGVSFVNVRTRGWDMHGNVERSIKKTGVPFDRGIAALVDDLYQRGLNKNVLVVAMGEFGRTPRVNKRAGRDHWGPVMSVMLSGGQYRMGQAIGTSSPKGEVPDDSPYRPEDVLTMIYRHMGIDPSLTFDDLSGRPRYILERRQEIGELI